ncbi:signal peptidase I [Terrarubrum flagellatum]|uniref:signal peptidase I n=1 Tax=Terrirubrum flagellatum TaxID=2895980 RepID=UPI0031450061
MTSAAESDPQVKPRRWWIAALLGLLSQPVAYLYVGRPRRAAATIVAFVLLGIFLWHGLNGRLAEPRGIAAMAAFLVFIALFTMIDAARIAIAERAYQLRVYNRWWIYAVVAVIVGFAGDVAFDPAYGVGRSVRPFAIASGSMLPTLRLGEKVMADMRAYDAREPECGDVIVFAAMDGQTVYLKRVIGLPGDVVQIRAGRLYLNGAPIPLEQAEPYSPSADDLVIEGKPVATQRETLPGGRKDQIILIAGSGLVDTTPPFTVPPGRVFVLGDNRSNSLDSRHPQVGFVPRDHILGRLSFIYWSRDWARIGARIE